MTLTSTTPRLSAADAGGHLRRCYDLSGVIAPLPSERDQNFAVECADGRRFVLKVANALERRALLEAQQAAMSRVAERTGLCPRVVAGPGDRTLFDIEANGQHHFLWLIEWLPGLPLGKTPDISPALWRQLGAGLARLDHALAEFTSPALARDFTWDLASAAETIESSLEGIGDGELRQVLRSLLGSYRRHCAPHLATLPRQTIHNDANDFNVLVDTERQPAQLVGFVDFGDMVTGPRVADLAIAIAYAMLDRPDPLATAGELAAGYHGEYPLGEEEIAALFGLACLRLGLSAVNAVRQHRENPDNEYLLISQRPVRSLLPRLSEIPFGLAENRLRISCGLLPGRMAANRPAPPAREVLLAERRRRIGPSVRLSYRQPVQIVRGWQQYLFDEQGRRYLDAYNNVAHVGHAHPEVVRAASEQLATLNTNTRYLHDRIVEYATRLCATLPPPLEVCFFLNSASEANELALRLARTATGARDLIVLEAAYHGHTSSLIDISPYKHAGPGGQGAPDWVHVAPLPDGYRGEFKYDDPQAGEKYAARVSALLAGIARQGRKPAGFIAETCPSVGGQIFFPSGYLAAAYREVREAGGVCIADEVQTGLGRLGSSLWGFLDEGVVPDMVVMGKPIGNGFPLGVVVSTREIAARFDNGMEFFSTFGGNPVACSVGLAVLGIVERDHLMEHAARVGDRLRNALLALKQRYPLIGDVRGRGLFLGLELVSDQNTREPAHVEAAAVADRLCQRGILLGTDGPLHNVVKIRPPMPFDENDADRLVGELDRILSEGFDSDLPSPGAGR